MALYPEDATLQAWTKISEAREFSGLLMVVFEALQAGLGSLGDALRNVAIPPADVWTGSDCYSACFGCKRATVDTDRSSAGGAVVAPRKESGLSSGRWEPSALCGRRPFCARPAGAGLDGSVVWRVGGGVGLERARRSQAQNVLLGRPGDDTEIRGASSKQVAAWHQQYITVMGAPPQEEEEPSADQLQALYHRTVLLGNAPYVDHAVWGLFGRKTTRANKFRTCIPTSDGSYISKELLGLENFQQWLSSWRVFEAAAIMLDLISMAALALYEKAIERLTRLWPSTWWSLPTTSAERSISRASGEVAR